MRLRTKTERVLVIIGVLIAAFAFMVNQDQQAAKRDAHNAAVLVWDYQRKAAIESCYNDLQHLVGEVSMDRHDDLTQQCYDLRIPPYPEQ